MSTTMGDHKKNGGRDGWAKARGLPCSLKLKRNVYIWICSSNKTVSKLITKKGRCHDTGLSFIHQI